jgi:2-keto-4-pentenoate hydratase/2-oxohepta-3-ene-1,7-dioic acid hydratase in catechol pathway
MNYVDHCTEQNMPIPVEPVIFKFVRSVAIAARINLRAGNLLPFGRCSDTHITPQIQATKDSPASLAPRSKFASCIAANGDDLVHPAETVELDYEVELTIVIGKEGRRISKETALEYVAGYTVAHDVSARDWQLKKNGGQWLLGKAMDGFAPIGPSIVTPDEVGDVHNLRLRTIVNGETLQDGNTKELVHNVPACIAWISKFITLKPGDIILTGTPPGVGCFRKPQLWLKEGDVVTVEIEKLGSITNKVVKDTSV